MLYTHGEVVAPSKKVRTKVHDHGLPQEQREANVTPVKTVRTKVHDHGLLQEQREASVTGFRE